MLVVNKDYKMMMMYDKGSRGNGRGHVNRSRLSFNKMMTTTTTMMMMMMMMMMTMMMTMIMIIK